MLLLCSEIKTSHLCVNNVTFSPFTFFPPYINLEDLLRVSNDAAPGGPRGQKRNEGVQDNATPRSECQTPDLPKNMQEFRS